MAKMIELIEVSKYYGSALALDHLSLSIETGELCVLIGPSGCGKTTCAKMVNRLVEPSSGRVIVNGLDVSAVNPQQLRRQIGYVIQSVGLFPHLTVGENVGLVPELLGWDRARISSRVDEVLDLVSLPPGRFRTKYPRELSGGEAQRVGVARALAADPPILIMDEPFGAVDPLVRDRLHVEFRQIQQQLHKTILFITHLIDEAILLADKIAIMRAGHIVQYDSVEGVLDHPADNFVKEFLGTDRALKRLLKIKVRDLVRAVGAVVDQAPDRLIEAALEHHQYVWIIDADGYLRGWMSRPFTPGIPLTQQMTGIDSSLVSVSEEASLNEALSRMLAQGVVALPVVDFKQRFLGEVSLDDIARFQSRQAVP